MQIRQIIIPTVRLAPGFYGASLDLGLRRVASYIAFSVPRVPCTGCIYERAPRLGYVTSYGSTEADLNRAESKGPQGVLTAGFGRHLTSLNMDYDGRDYPSRSSHEIRTHVGETVIIMHARLTR